MKVTIKEACYVDGKPCKPGDVVDTARFSLLIGAGKAEKYVEPVKADPVKEPATRVPVDQTNRANRNGK